MKSRSGRRGRTRPGAGCGSECRHTVVFFHAHPDDESIYTGGTMAALAAAGHRTVLVTATDGEAGLTASGLIDGLGDRRAGELEAAAAALGVSRVVRLGFADSGSDLGAVPPGSFALVSPDEAAVPLAAILRQESAEILTVYDPAGGYGHPDHVQVHAVGRRAALLVGTPAVLEATVDRRAVHGVLRLVGWLPFLPEGFDARAAQGWYVDHHDITHVVDVRAHTRHKRAALQAHRSQRLSDGRARTLGVFLRLPAWLFDRLLGREWFVHRESAGRPVSGDVLGLLHPAQDLPGATSVPSLDR